MLEESLARRCSILLNKLEIMQFSVHDMYDLADVMCWSNLVYTMKLMRDDYALLPSC